MADYNPQQDGAEGQYQAKDALARQNVGAWGAVTRFGGTTATFGEDMERTMPIVGTG